MCYGERLRHQKEAKEWGCNFKQSSHCDNNLKDMKEQVMLISRYKN